MCQNVMRPQPTVILMVIVEERRTIFPDVPEENRRRAPQENEEPINLSMDQDNFGESFYLEVFHFILQIHL